jgi:hypothetical protein
MSGSVSVWDIHKNTNVPLILKMREIIFFVCLLPAKKKLSRTFRINGTLKVKEILLLKERKQFVFTEEYPKIRFARV